METTNLKEFDVLCSQTLSKSVRIKTEEDDEIDWAYEYGENRHYTPLELLSEFKALIKETIQSYEPELINILSDPRKTSEVADKIRRLSHLSDECNNWIEDDLIVEEE